MGSEGLERVLGKAVLDKAFMTELKRDPATAAQSVGTTLSDNEIETFKNLDFGGVEVFNKIASSTISSLAHEHDDVDHDAM
jgi:hypothetical protein